MNPSGNGNNDRTMHPSVEAAINSELANVEAQLEREKQRRRELEAMQVPPLQMDNVSYEQLEQLRNSLMMFNGGASSAAGVKPSPP